MKEIPARSNLDGIELFAEAGSYSIEVSSALGILVVSSDSYHPGRLVLTREDLLSLLRALGEPGRAVCESVTD